MKAKKKNPALFFALWNVNIDEFISQAITHKSQMLLEKSKTKSSRIIDDTDISKIFKIEMEAEQEKELKKSVTKKADKKKKPAGTGTKRAGCE